MSQPQVRCGAGHKTSPHPALKRTLSQMIGVELVEVWKGWMGGQHESRVIDRVIENDGNSGTGQAWVGS